MRFFQFLFTNTLWALEKVAALAAVIVIFFGLIEQKSFAQCSSGGGGEGYGGYIPVPQKYDFEAQSLQKKYSYIADRPLTGRGTINIPYDKAQDINEHRRYEDISRAIGIIESAYTYDRVDNVVQALLDLSQPGDRFLIDYLTKKKSMVRGSLKEKYQAALEKVFSKSEPSLLQVELNKCKEELKSAKERLSEKDKSLIDEAFNNSSAHGK